MTGTIDGGAYRDAMARFASAVHLVTTEGPAGRAGFTASAVCSVSDAPPTLLVCLNRRSSAYAVFSRHETLCVNTLSAEQAEIAGAFGSRMPMAKRFATAAWGRLATGAPVLAGALVAFDCRIVSRTEVGTHDVMFCEAVAIALHGDGGGERGLVYADRRYHALAPVTHSAAKRGIARPGPLKAAIPA